MYGPQTPAWATLSDPLLDVLGVLARLSFNPGRLSCFIIEALPSRTW
jgi:hypothetical protein